MQSFMLSSKSAQFLEFMDLRTRTTANELLTFMKIGRDANQLRTVPRIPYDVSSRRSSVSWSTVSKAAERSSSVSTAKSSRSSAP